MGAVVSKQQYKMDILEAALMDTLSTPTIKFVLDNTYRTFRTAREIEKDGHGNYICGAIEFSQPPKLNEEVRLELSLVPAEDTSQNNHGIHPNLLSITIKDRHKRIKYRGNLTNPKAWKLVLLIKNGEIFYQDHDQGIQMKVDDLVDGNKLLLGNYMETGMEHILMTIVTPLKKKDTDGALVVEKVVEERLKSDKDRWSSHDCDELTIKSISKEFTTGESKRELHRCRLRACLFQDKTDSFKVSEAFSEAINDTRDKNFGNFRIASMSEPHGACEKGGWKHFLITKSRVATSGFFPVFVFASSPNDIKPQKVDSLFKGFKQISCEKEDLVIFHNSTFKFKIPNQQRSVIQAIKHYHLKIYITLYRVADGQYAQEMVRFDYHDIHDDSDPDTDEECPFCQIKKNQPLNEMLKNVDGKRKRRRRDRNDSSYESGSNLGSPRSMIGNTDEISQQATPGVVSLSVPSPQYWPILDLTDRDFNQIVNPPAPNSVPSYIMDFGLDEFRPAGNMIDGELVKDGIEKSNTANITDSETDSDTEYDSSETESDTSFDEEEEDQDVVLINNLCKVTKTLKMDE